ncbi:MAG: preprotein translocase subunit SecG [Chloroflexia bacterium]
MDYVLYIVFILACFALVVSVLLQPGKADAGALFTSSVSSTAFGPRGTQTLLAKITWRRRPVVLIALTLALPGVSGPRSVVDGTADVLATPPQSSPGAGWVAADDRSARDRRTEWVGADEPTPQTPATRIKRAPIRPRTCRPALPATNANSNR